MYGTGRRFGLGDTALDPSLLFTSDPSLLFTSDPGYDPNAVDPTGGGGGSIALTPTVTTTPGNTGGNAPLPPPQPLYGPQAIGPTSVPQTLPPLVANAPDYSWFLLGAAAFVVVRKMKQGRR